MNFNIIEKFVSIDGEGSSAGELATFIRFSGCNLRCSWCDTKYSWDGSVRPETMNVAKICDYVEKTGVFNLTLTGGEPLIQPYIDVLISKLLENSELTIRIETHGGVNITEFRAQFPNERVQFIVDYKLPSSKMEVQMCALNLQVIGSADIYKFVIASERDLQLAIDIVLQEDLTNRCQVYFSPVVDLIDSRDIVSAMVDNKLNRVKLQLQLHKYIWPKDMRGV